MGAKTFLVASVVAIGLQSASAHATTFANYHPTNSSFNIGLTGLSLSASSPVVFDYLTSSLSPLGDLSATLTLSATETGAIAFGPISLATFDGSFSFAYSGPTKTVGSITVTTGEDLLSGTFLGSVFTGYGSTSSLIDSILGGGLVSFNNNPLLTFDPLQDQGLSINMTSMTPPSVVVGGMLTDFKAVSGGLFSAEVTSSTPEPATWALMLIGFGLAGTAVRRRRGALTA